MAKISTMFLTAANKAMFNSSEWKPTGEEHSLKEYWDAVQPGLYKKIDGEVAQVTATTFSDGNVGLRITVPIKGGDTIDLKLSGKSTLEEDDYVLVDTIKAVALRKVGQDDIVRFDGELFEGEIETEE